LFPCRLDTAWLWPYDETKRKVARSWASQLRLIEQYPSYVFTASQAQQYEWLLEYYPDLFRQIQEKVEKGQWEIIGGVSSICTLNYSGAETCKLTYGGFCHASFQSWVEHGKRREKYRMIRRSRDGILTHNGNVTEFIKIRTCHLVKRLDDRCC
jgi:hypothetical protein